METNMLGKKVRFTHKDWDEGEGTDGIVAVVYVRSNEIYFLVKVVRDVTQFVEVRAVDCWQE